MTDCSRDSNPPELLEQLGNSSDYWVVEGRCDVQNKLRGGREYVVWVCGWCDEYAAFSTSSAIQEDEEARE